jgi:hypothetical protein
MHGLRIKLQDGRIESSTPDGAIVYPATGKSRRDLSAQRTLAMGMPVEEKHVVSKKRVADHGEVYTRPREVNAMLDLVKQETERVDSRFLEPACGHGNFLVEVLTRKLRVVERRYARSPVEYERYILLAVCSIYGIDILEDNVRQCRDRLFGMVAQRFNSLFSQEEFLRTVRFVLERNIIWGDALTLRTVGPDSKPIIFAEWSLVNGSMVNRTDYSFHELLSHAHTRQTPLFSDLGEEVFLPEPVKRYPLTHYLRLADAEGN